MTAGAVSEFKKMRGIAMDERRSGSHAFSQRGGTCVKCGMTGNAFWGGARACLYCLIGDSFDGDCEWG